jgi:hypothetical protein
MLLVGMAEFSDVKKKFCYISDVCVCVCVNVVVDLLILSSS